jgi:hypothetical protein
LNSKNKGDYQMKHKTFFAIVAITLMATSCLKVTKKSEAVPQPAKAQSTPAQTQQPKVINRELRLDDVFVEFVGKPQPNLYDMIFSWPETRDRVRISLDGKVAFAVNTSERPQEGIANLQGGRKLSVLFEVLDQQSHVITSQTRDLEVPKDYVFSRDYKLTYDLNISNDRVFMNNSIITTENFNLVIKTKKLIVLDQDASVGKSRIQNFPLNLKALHGSHGRSGGSIRIEALSAEGDLTFTMNSEAGGDALQGNYWGNQSYCIYGTNGYNAGQNGDLNIKVQDPKDFRAYPNEILSLGGNIAPVLKANEPEDYPRISKYDVSSIICPQRPSIGAGSQPGKMCLTYLGQVPEAGCE